MYQKMIGFFKNYSFSKVFYPKIFTTLKNYNKQTFFSDFIAGIIVGIVAIPLAIAFAIASGVSPEKGLITAVIAGFLISFLGGSWVQIGGPTGAFVIIISGIIAEHGVNGLLIATLMAGIMLVFMGFAKLGTLMKFIPYPLIVGFTSGIAVIIFSTQMNDFFGLKLSHIPSAFLGKWQVYFSSFNHIDFFALLVGGGSLFLTLLWNRFFKKIPGTLIALIVFTALVQILNLPVETIQTRFGAISASFSLPSLPSFNFELIAKLIQPAFTIALLAGIESLLSAMVADGMIGGKHRSNTELIAQGVANIFSPLFGGIPATGAIARTATNVKNGGKTPVAGIIHALFLLFIMLFFGKWAALIPLPCLAAILILVAYNMSEWHSFKLLLKGPKEDVVVLLITFFLTVFVDLTVAIEMGMVLAVFLFMRRMAITSNISIFTQEFKEQYEEPIDPFSIQNRQIPTGVEVYEISGPFFFGAVEKFKEAMLQVGKTPKIRIIRMRNVPVIDSTGIRLLKDVHEDSLKKGTFMIISGINPKPLQAFKQSGLFYKIGKENICANIDLALYRAKEILGITPLLLESKIAKGGIYHIDADHVLDAIKKTIDLIPHIPKSRKEQIQQDLINREELSSTAIGHGILLPHPKKPIVDFLEKEEDLVAVSFLKEPIIAQTPDNEPIHTLIVVLTSNAQSHLELLSKITSFCQIPEFILLLKRKPKLEEILDFIKKHESPLKD